ncbi:ATP-dependent helicase HrpB [Chelatococcus asaccharovorans]|uniref:ATP-dependent helicase HrpB n=1 Tax=Chelatococcus asaccharovorans TaxID=28210 RepID=A0A2V3U0J0_9HYPH|nr:ATP-dependent helicase HrpB [Chelatococcus asaccharovorans]MBS7704854.1 ATP-dependent helicase HrpB [Chelatococcus asaccharovorans]PXW54751.1 ATP-dependent helicase HrpB [Chelatococcus asaccharovorans]
MAASSFPTPLPIDEALPALTGHLRAASHAVLVAPPGAGKTTRVPLVLIGEPWVAGGRIILLEPRRLAARGAAARMAATLGEAVGETVGLRVRLGSKIGPKTRIEVVTEGVFTRMILDDPELTGVAAVLFDEFHERSLDADFGLALALDAQVGLRPDLRILVMSATLDGARVARLLGDAPVVESEGRAYPVETRYLGRDPQRRIEDEVTEAVMRALRAEPGSLLVFLPGQGEIRRVEERLAQRITDPAVDLAPLYGAMDRAAQDKAVEPAAPGRRKIVLATSIAETSLTINGVRVVIDSGLARVPRYEPDIGLTRLETVRVSRAAADQRRGRAGRTEPGVCYRLWEEASTGALEPFAKPEILAADLAPLLIAAAAWGVADPATLAFLDPPPKPALAEARRLLVDLDALDADGRLTETGRRLQALPLPPRLARMVIAAAGEGQAGMAAEIAAVLVERGLGGTGTDLAERLGRFRGERSPQARDMRRMAEGWARTASVGPREPDEPGDAGALLALAFPDRIAKARGKPGEFLMANGRAAALDPADALARSPYLAIAEIAGSGATARILLAAPLTPEAVEHLAEDRIVTTTEVTFDRQARALRAREARRLDALVLGERPLPVPADVATAGILAKGIAGLGLAVLPWTKAISQWRERVMFLARAEGEEWPDLSDAALTAGITDWLGPYLVGKAGLAAISASDLDAALKALLPWDLQRRLEAEAPTHVTMPTGSNIPVDYGGEEGPGIAVRVQELFGLTRHPTLAGGRVPLVLSLLSPAHRPIQITRDLPAFWRGSWADVRSEMRGRYPKHPWPEDPASAAPTTRVKPRGT